MIERLLPVLCTFLFFHATAFADRLSQSELPHAATGAIIHQLATAIENPQPASEDMQIIRQYGTDTRFYILTRGWLVQYLQMTDSQLSVEQTPDKRQQLYQRYIFLKKALRQIDLE